MICPKCGGELSKLLIQEGNVISKSLTDIMFCVKCQEFYTLVPKKVVRFVEVSEK